MPGMNGWDLARALRAAGQTQARIIMVSANAGHIAPAGGEAPAQDDVLAKPISIPALLNMTGRLLNMHWLPEPGGSVAPAAAPRLADGALSQRNQADLRHLAAIGYVRGIKARLDELADEQPDLEVQLAHLRDLVGTFRLPEFIAALDGTSIHAD